LPATVLADLWTQHRTDLEVELIDVYTDAFAGRATPDQLRAADREWHRRLARLTADLPAALTHHTPTTPHPRPTPPPPPPPPPPRHTHRRPDRPPRPGRQRRRQPQPRRRGFRPEGAAAGPGRAHPGRPAGGGRAPGAPFRPHPGRARPLRPRPGRGARRGGQP